MRLTRGSPVPGSTSEPGTTALIARQPPLATGDTAGNGRTGRDANSRHAGISGNRLAGEGARPSRSLFMSRRLCYRRE